MNPSSRLACCCTGSFGAVFAGQMAAVVEEGGWNALHRRGLRHVSP